MITLFLDQAVINLLDCIGEGFDECPNKEDTVVEYLHLPLTAIVEYEGMNADIRVFDRDDKMSRTKIGHVGSVEDMEIVTKLGDEDTIMITVCMSDFVNNYLYTEGLLEKYKDLKDDEGLLIEAEGEELKVTVVKGDDRPSLPCHNKNKEVVMCKP